MPVDTVSRETRQEDEPPSSGDISLEKSSDESKNKKSGWFKRFFATSNDDRLREAVEEFIEEADNSDDEDAIARSHERILLSNILKFRDLKAENVMVPRADIIAVDSKTKKDDLMKTYAETPRSRLPVFKENIDNILGTVHIKDFLGQLASDQKFSLSKITREVPIISPSMPVMDLLIQMRETRNHMALIVDEFGGIDGLVTLGDLIEAITGEIDDIYDEDINPQIKLHTNNTYLADARLSIKDFESEVGMEDLIDENEREEIDTLAGFVFSWAGRVPAKGEIIEHPSGLSFEVVDGDTRRIRKIRIRKKSSLKTV